MARLLRNNDYLRNIQSDNLLQIIESNNNLRLEVEQSAQSEMISYLTQRYLTDKIFTDTKSFSIGATYFGKQLVEYTEAAYSATATYSAGNRVLYNGKIYSSIAGNVPQAFTPANWTYITEDLTLYYSKTPNAEWNYTTSYSFGDIVWYNDISYTAKSDNTGVLPTDTNTWTAGSAYSFSGYYPDNATYWTKGDNRNQLIVMYLIDITLYHLHARINPRNTPELRYVRYDGNNALQTGGAIGWLKKVASGDITADLPVIYALQGNRIRYGSIQKNINNY
jgi:hypothetical protein